MKTLETINGQKVWAVEDSFHTHGCAICMFRNDNGICLAPRINCIGKYYIPHEEELKEKTFTVSQINKVIDELIGHPCTKDSDVSWNASLRVLQTKIRTVMKTEKIKRYRMSVSRTFPQRHPRAGEPTLFREKILKGCNQLLDPFHILTNLNPKIHTIRANYPLWKKRLEEVQAGKAVIELFYWQDKPYRSPQVVFTTLDKDSGCWVQKLGFSSGKIHYPFIEIDNINHLSVDIIAQNDGLSFVDFESWFKGYDLSEPMAIIHFTSFRY